MIKKVRVIKHSWLDCSASWFVEIGETRAGGEISSEREAIETAKELAQKLNLEFDTSIINTNELFS